MLIWNICTTVSVLSICVCICSSLDGRQCPGKSERCGDGICCCNGETATCIFKDGIQYIPKLPLGIKKVNFDNKYLFNISKHTFSNISMLDLNEMTLQRDCIHSISSDSFSTFKKLRQLDISLNNQINATELAMVLRSIPQLEELGLNDIGLSALNVKLFNVTNKSNVRTVKLNNNRIVFLNFRVFKGFSSLKELWFDKNRIQSLSDICLLPSLKTLILSDNIITSHPPNFCSSNSTINKLPNLQRLDLRGNYIKYIADTVWHCLKGLKKLQLSGNLIISIPDNVFSRLTNLHTLMIADMQGSLKHLHKLSFNSSSLQKLDMSSNKLVFYQLLKRDMEVIHMFEYCRNLTELHMSGNNLVRINETNILQLLSPLARVQKLYMIETHFNKIPTRLLGNFNQLILLVLDGNAIDHLENAFNEVKTLQKLSIQGNRIKVIRKEAFPINMMLSLTSLNLGSNPFECTCDLLWFRHWIDEHLNSNISLVNWPWRYVCGSPINMVGKKLKQFHPTAEMCRYRNPLTVVYIAIGSFVAIFLVVVVIVYTNRWYIKYVLYNIKLKIKKSTPESTPLLGQTGKRFDGYVIYTDADSAFVHHDFRTMIEDQFGYKLHIWHRNAENGAKLEVMVDAMYASNTVVAIISKSFLKDAWCQFQLNVAMDRAIVGDQERVLLVLLEDIDVKILSKYWCVVLTKTPTAYCCVKEDDIKKKVFEQTLKQHFSTTAQPRIQKE